MPGRFSANKRTFVIAMSVAGAFPGLVIGNRPAESQQTLNESRHHGLDTGACSDRLGAFPGAIDQHTTPSYDVNPHVFADGRFPRLDSLFSYVVHKIIACLYPIFHKAVT